MLSKHENTKHNYKTLFFSPPPLVTGAFITGPSPFETDGSRDLHLFCEASDAAEVTQYAWGGGAVVCLQQDHNRCTLRPQPPWDDGVNVTCSVTYITGQSAAATFAIDLNCE